MTAPLITRRKPRSMHYNAGSAHDETVENEIVAAIKEHQPDFFSFNEVGDRAKVLKMVARRTGYTLVQMFNGPSSHHIAALVHPDAKFRKGKRAPHIEQISPATEVGHNTAGARRDGRAEPKYILTVPLVIWRYKVVFRKRIPIRRYGRPYGVWHLVPSAMRHGNDRTRALYERQMRAGVAWVKSHGRKATLQGDINADISDPHEEVLAAPLKKVANLHSAPSRGHRWIDVFATLLKGTVRALLGSSDHKMMVFDENA